MLSNVETTDHDEAQLHTFAAACLNNPLAFVEAFYPWPINGEPGPDLWQRELLEEIRRQVIARRFNGVDPVLPLRMAISKGHGVGGSTLVAWIVDWIMSTRPFCKGTITANTNDQIQLKTWSAIREWTARLINAHWFDINSAIMFRKGYRAEWFCAPQSCAEENSEAFAGQHAKNSTSFYVNDEDSAVPDKIHEVQEGGLTDGEPMQFLLANPTRNTGAFYRAAFGSARDRYIVRVIDSRTSKFSNKTLIAQWEEDYGLESDFFKVRVRGLPPSADELQYVDAARIAQAQTNMPYAVVDEPLIAGVDVSGGGAAWTVCMFRKGFDARSLRPITLTGEQTVANERQLVVDVLANALNEHPVTAMFIDVAFGAPIAVRLKQMGFHNVHEVNFGGPSADALAENARAAMWKSVKEWLPKGAIDHQDHRLAMELAGPGFHLNKRNKLVIESKAEMLRRGVASPDRADALALTFAMPVRVPNKRQARWGAVAASPWA
jgi:hypothetical protein